MGTIKNKDLKDKKAPKGSEELSEEDMNSVKGGADLLSSSSGVTFDPKGGGIVRSLKFESMNTRD